ncbi:unnamed product [Ostreococcus tauri]|uniref:Unnamed product n=1 Tax=Ostreococcus tauri TaxID=70448 RepID=A0A090N4A0_OSTTA|nr:unnamed product [Ostreococcus tauri]CEF99503.1 unnamed product [Ostreococcus tauri]|eukprot:XP_022839872.1 unnamed product [Ostreococcus tauri]
MASDANVRASENEAPKTNEMTSNKSSLRAKYEALSESRNKYKEEAEEAKRTIMALERRVVDLEAELSSPTNQRNLAVDLAEVKGELEAANAALLKEKNRAAKSEGRAERVAKLERDKLELLRSVDALMRTRTTDRLMYVTIGALVGAGTALSMYTFYLKSHRA